MTQEIFSEIRKIFNSSTMRFDEMNNNIYFLHFTYNDAIDLQKITERYDYLWYVDRNDNKDILGYYVKVHIFKRKFMEE